MKKIFLLVLFAISGGITQLSAQIPIPFPIPSYDVHVNSISDFHEYMMNPYFPSLNSKGERVLVVKVKGLSSNIATIWVYSLDGLDRIGPFYVHGGEMIRVPIDNREWGTSVECEDPVDVDIWIDWEAKGAGEGVINPFSVQVQGDGRSMIEGSEMPG
jgi:hypothetical protein